MSETFIPEKPSLEDYWRGIILLGRNVASYKFALAKTLLELKPEAGQLVKLGELAPNFAKNITEHLKLADKQGTSASSRYLDGCRKFNNGNLTENELNEFTVKYGFVNVIDAFHVLGTETVSEKFYLDERKENSGIRITEEFSKLLETTQAINLPKEVDARWDLVQTAWSLGISNSLISINYDAEKEILFTFDRTRKRKTVTSCRDAICGYQKGKCFYCFSDISLTSDGGLSTEVDHFFPNKLKDFKFIGIDSVWNLVLSCWECNRGHRGKFESIPHERLLERLNKRNEYYIESHHPLRETLILQTGKSKKQRKNFLNDYYNRAWSRLIHRWEPEEKEEAAF